MLVNKLVAKELELIGTFLSNEEFRWAVDALVGMAPDALPRAAEVTLDGRVLLFTVAVGLFLSCANLFFRDVKYIVQVVLMFGIFFTPIFFEPAMLGARGAHSPARG